MRLALLMSLLRTFSTGCFLCATQAPTVLETSSRNVRRLRRKVRIPVSCFNGQRWLREHLSPWPALFSTSPPTPAKVSLFFFFVSLKWAN
jgi:hypothetical protein